MEKGKLGIRLSVYAVLAFILAAFGLYLGIIGLLAVVLIVEKDEWASRQVLQALMLCLLPSMIGAVFDVLGFMNWFGWGSYGSAVYTISSIWSRFRNQLAGKHRRICICTDWYSQCFQGQRSRYSRIRKLR